MDLDEGKALLRGICEDPDDDAPRLIYSDWLEENGYPHQAGDIRRMIERPEIVVQFGHGRGIECWVNRGFVFKIRPTVPEYKKHLSRLFQWPITEVEMWDSFRFQAGDVFEQLWGGVPPYPLNQIGGLKRTNLSAVLVDYGRRTVGLKPYIERNLFMPKPEGWTLFPECPVCQAALDETDGKFACKECQWPEGN